MTNKFIPILILLPQVVYGWGTVGHRTVGTVAEKLLTPAVNREIQKHLQGDRLADVANWADSLKANPSDWNHTKAYHFESVPDGMTYLQSKKAMTPEEKRQGGTIEALLEAQSIFLSAKTSSLEKSNALKFIVHFVGDIHQPLHSGRPEDNGGNKIPIKWNGRNTNLHAVWDSYIIQEAYEEFSRAQQAPQISDEDYADYLIDKFSGSPAPTKLDDFNHWLDESISYRAAAYDYKNLSETAYTRKFIPVVDSRIYRAGYRLAAVLHRLMKKQAPTANQMSLRSALEKISGPLKSFIFLKPQRMNSGSKGYTPQDLTVSESWCAPFSFEARSLE